MEELLAVLNDCCPTVDFANEKKLLSGSVLDSMDVVNIISAVEEAYDVDIEFEMITAENFDSAEQIYALIMRLRRE